MIENVGGEDNAVESKDKSRDKKRSAAGHVQQQLHSAACSAALFSPSSSSHSTWQAGLSLPSHITYHFLFKLQINVNDCSLIRQRPTVLPRALTSIRNTPMRARLSENIKMCQ